MTITKISSCEFDRDISRAKRAAKKGPVIVTDRGQPAYVLLRYDAYQRLAGEVQGIRALLQFPGVEDIEFDPPRMVAESSSLKLGLISLPDAGLLSESRCRESGATILAAHPSCA